MSYAGSLLVFLFIGFMAGWVAGVFIKGRGFGGTVDIFAGILGAELGGWIFGKMGIPAYRPTGAVVTAFVGALAFLAVVKLARNVSYASSI